MQKSAPRETHEDQTASPDEEGYGLDGHRYGQSGSTNRATAHGDRARDYPWTVHRRCYDDPWVSVIAPYDTVKHP